MANRWTNTLTHNDVTPQGAFLNRRQLIVGAASGFGLAGVGKTLHSIITSTNLGRARPILPPMQVH
jgi:hypothetical protein